MGDLLERDAVLGALARAANRGVGRVVLLRGEAGVGKTAVITRFTASLDGGLRVLRGWCDPLVAPRPLGPLLAELAVAEWTRRDCPYDVAIAQLGGDVTAVVAGAPTRYRIRTG